MCSIIFENNNKTDPNNVDPAVVKNCQLIFSQVSVHMVVGIWRFPRNHRYVQLYPSEDWIPNSVCLEDKIEDLKLVKFSDIQTQNAMYKLPLRIKNSLMRGYFCILPKSNWCSGELSSSSVNASSDPSSIISLMDRLCLVDVKKIIPVFIALVYFYRDCRAVDRWDLNHGSRWM